MNPEESQIVKDPTHERVLFYSKDWIYTNFIYEFQIDIAITEEFLYLIKLPSSLFRQIFYFFFDSSRQGLMTNVFSFEKTDSKIREGWLDSDQQLMLEKCEKITILKIPKEVLKNSVFFLPGPFKAEGSEISFKYSGKEISLNSRSENLLKENSRLKNYIESL